MLLTKFVSAVFGVSTVTILVHVLTGRHELLASQVSSVLHNSFVSHSSFPTHRDQDPPLLEVRHEGIKGMEVVLLRVRKPRGVYLVFPGCSHKPTDWWHNHPNCVTCIGLPEELRISRTLTGAGYDVAVLSPRDRRTRCWDAGHGGPSADIPRVARVLDVLMARDYRWMGLPHYALGVSSGGALALTLAQTMPLAGVCSQIMALPPSLLAPPRRPPEGDPQRPPYPPTMFVHMARDKRMAGWVAENVEALKSQGVYTRNVLVRPLALTPAIFAERVDGIDNATSAAMHAALQGAHLLDWQGRLLQDPRMAAKRWQQVLTENVPAIRDFSLQLDQSAIFQVLNVAWAGHEIVSDHTEEMIDFFRRPRFGDDAMQLGRRRLLGESGDDAMQLGPRRLLWESGTDAMQLEPRLLGQPGDMGALQPGRRLLWRRGRQRGPSSRGREGSRGQSHDVGAVRLARGAGRELGLRTQ